MKIRDEMNVWKNFRDYVGLPAVFESMAEECVELAHVALKAARCLRKDNPTPANYDDLLQDIEEEFTDLVSCAIAVGIEPDSDLSVRKFQRMKQRIETQKGR